MILPKLTLPLGREEIAQILPHREPFLFIDQVVELEPKKHIKAFKNITLKESFFKGHFPNFPIMPGVLQVEAIAQAGGILAFFSNELDPKANIALLAGIEKAKFRKPVIPDAKLILTAEIISLKSNVCKIKGAACVDNIKTCEAIITAMIMPAKN